MRKPKNKILPLLNEDQRLVIVQDTREQAGWTRFDPGLFLLQRGQEREGEIKGLVTADYTLRGFEDRILIERKYEDKPYEPARVRGSGDFVTSLFKDRFEREMIRMARVQRKLLICEGITWDDVSRGDYRSQTNPKSIWGKCISLYLRYGVPVYLFRTRKRTIKFVEDAFRLFAKHIIEDYRKMKRRRRIVSRPSLPRVSPGSGRFPPSHAESRRAIRDYTRLMSRGIDTVK